MTTPAEGQPEATVPSGDATVNEPASAAPYQEYLDRFPESVRTLAEPVFKEWDSNVTQRFQKIQSEYDPYKDVIEQYHPDAVKLAVQTLEALDRDPRAFYEMLASNYGFADQGTTGTEPQTQDPAPGANTDPAPTGDPRYDELMRNQQLIAQVLVQREQEVESQRNSMALEAELSRLKTAKGDFDENYVLPLIAQGIPPEKAVDQFMSAVQQYATRQNQPNAQNPAPTVMSSAGGIQSSQNDIRKMRGKETKNLVAEYLAAAHAQNQ